MYHRRLHSEIVYDELFSLGYTMPCKSFVSFLCEKKWIKLWFSEPFFCSVFKRCCCFYQSHLVWGHYFKHINEELWWLTEWTLPYTVIITGNCTCLWPWQISTTSCLQCYGIYMYLQNKHVQLYTAILLYVVSVETNICRQFFAFRVNYR